jgi:acetoacetate decarboxylase
VRIVVATVDLGRGRPPFGAGTFGVSALHDDLPGDYALVMPMTTEQAVIGGRETFGEPKKLGEVRLDRYPDPDPGPDSDPGPAGGLVRGSFARMGVTFVEVNGRVVEELPAPAETVRTSFYLKFLPAPDGKGFDHEPALVHVRRREKTRSLFRVEGEVVLRESQFDPVADLPVRRLVSIELVERSSVQTGAVVCRVPAGVVAPYVHQRYDDLSPVGTE